MRPLVLGVGNAVGLSTIQTLKYVDEQRTVIVADKLHLAQGLYRDNVKPHIVNEQTLVDDVIAIVKRENVGSLFVSEPEYLYSLVDRKTYFEEETGLSIPPKKLVTRSFDKRRMAKKFGSYSPELVTLKDIEEEELEHPVIVRPRYTTREGGPAIVDNLRDLRFQYKSLEEEGLDPFIQKYIPGPDECEYIVPLIYDGNLVSDMVVQVLKKNWNFAGSLLSSRVVKDQDILKTATEIAEDIREEYGSFTWPLTVHLKKDPNGECRLLKIEPRLWESQYLAAQAGFNYPETIHRLATGMQLQNMHYSKVGIEAVKKTVYNGVSRDSLLNNPDT